MGIYLAQPSTEKNIVMKNCPSQGIKFTLCEMQGWRREMEDSSICVTNLGDGNSLFAVFDGHGGPEVSLYVKEKFISLLLHTPSYELGFYYDALFQTFKRMDDKIASDEGEFELRKLSQKRNMKMSQKDIKNKRLSDSVGCTAHVILITPKQYFVANSGDSRSIIWRKGKTYSLSHDHKPEDINELNRIVSAGGKISNGRINNGLNLSRSFGDFSYKSNSMLPSSLQMVICDPDIRVYDRIPEDQFIFIGCDGVFERYLFDQRPLGKKIHSELKRKAESESILQKLLDSLLGKTSKELYGCDNMTCILVELNA